ncbi:MAG: hypothetical protein K0S55_2187, partial [Clostridia bacterium]|nr:hypothetical protein [Clostridia bacterium]
DALSGIKAIEYKKVSEELSYNNYGNWTLGNTISVSTDEKFFVYARITDNAGNITIINSDGVVVYSDSAIEASTEYFNKDETSSEYEDIQVTINLNHNTIKDIRNGESILAEGTDYTINGNIITLKKEYLRKAINGSLILTFIFNPMGEEFNDGDEPEKAQLTIMEIINDQNSPLPQISNDTPNAILLEESNKINEAVLTDNDKEKLAGGSNLSIYLMAEKIEALDTDKVAVITKLAGKTLGQYFNISLIKNIDGIETQVKQTNNPIKITVDIPENLRESNRIFSFIRVYNGLATTLLDLDDNPNTITIETDCFSTYAIVYSYATSDPVKNPNTEDD